jgi:alkylation response protein AidB-like acyl-CoA dehydrogenase
MTFHIPRSSPGIHAEDIDTMGIRGRPTQCDVTLENVWASPELILGDEDAGSGAPLWSAPPWSGCSLGIARGALEHCTWARSR